MLLHEYGWLVPPVTLFCRLVCCLPAIRAQLDSWRLVSRFFRCTALSGFSIARAVFHLVRTSAGLYMYVYNYRTHSALEMS